MSKHLNSTIFRCSVPPHPVRLDPNSRPLGLPERHNMQNVSTQAESSESRG